MSCNTSWMYKGNCSGGTRTCNGCGETYCSYHYVGVQPSRAAGGHICPRACDTSAMFVNNCSGANYKCPGCDYRFCEYHLLPVAHIGVLTGGHVCSNTSGASIVDQALRGTISNVNDFVRQAGSLLG